MSEKRKILIISDLFPANEEDYAGIYVVDYANSIKEWYDVQVFHPRLINDITGISNSEIHGLKVTRFSMFDKPIGKLKKFTAYSKWFKESAKIGSSLGAFDLIHAHGSALAGNVARTIAKTQGIKYVITEHTGPFSTISENPIRLKFCKKAIKDCAALFNVSKHSQNEMKAAGVSHINQVVTYNPVNDKVFNLELKPNKSFLFVGRFDEFKGATRALKAFLSSDLHNNGWSFTFIGAGEEEKELKELAIGKNDAVQFLGMCSKPKIAEEMAKSSALVFPSRHETFGLVAAEAICSGIPVITTNSTGPSEFISDENGIKIDPDSIEELTSAMLDIAKKEKIFQTATVKNSAKQFHLSSFGARLNELYLQHIES